MFKEMTPGALFDFVFEEIGRWVCTYPKKCGESFLRGSLNHLIKGQLKIGMGSMVDGVGKKCRWSMFDWI